MALVMAEYNEKTFKGMTDMDLVMLRYEASKIPEDADFCTAILVEMSRRVKSKNN